MRIFSNPSPPSNCSEPLLRPVMPELDTIRGIAILSVLLYHSFYWQIDVPRFSGITRVFLRGMSVGRLGVNLFFVLSGFLITGLLVDSRRRPNFYSRFYVRRALRILPAYLATLFILAVTSLAPMSFIVLSLLYLSNLTPLIGVPIAYPVLWSLAVEEHFYLLWPMVVRKLRNRQLLVLCAAIIIASPILRLATFYLTEQNGRVFYLCNDYTWNSADGLACGALLALVLREYSLSRRGLLILAGICCLTGLSILLVSLPYGIISRENQVGASLQVVPWHLFFVALLALFLLLGSSRFKGVVQVKPLMLLGEISYGVYLYHLLVFDAFDSLARRGFFSSLHLQPFSALLFRFLVVSTVVCLVSLFSRRQFEDRFLALKKRLAPD
jgi:peptidoglycan/LPS O-acetylase OafA/YrhL